MEYYRLYSFLWLNASPPAVGDGPAHAEMQQELAGLPVTFAGYLRGEALATAYASADIFAFPSRTETFGQVVLEAMASGLPIVGLLAEGVCDLVTDGCTGLLDVQRIEEEEQVTVMEVPASSSTNSIMGVVVCYTPGTFCTTILI